jgi:aspartyl-tRNA(Asn)/glutamyl-tRNA(Gln) amidotransferase subunit A
MSEPDELWEWGAAALSAAYRAGTVSPVDVVTSCLARIEATDPRLNAFCLLDPDSALHQARAAERRLGEGHPLGPLDGVPVAVKDLLLTRDWPTRRGSRRTDPEPGSLDAPVVARLRAAGTVLVGKTTTPEFGWKAVTDSPLTGVTRNPWDPRRTPGGSSGGSAAAVAAGMVPLAIGTDGGGSIRIPSAFCGIVGLKPTHGRVPQSPPSPFGVLSHIGPHARDAADATLLLRAIAGPSSVDPFTDGVVALGGPPERRSLAGLRVAYSPTLGFASVEPDVASLVERAVTEVERLGAAVELVPSVLHDPIGLFETLWYAGAARTLAALGSDAEVDPGLVEFARRGDRLSAAAYVSALEGRATLVADVESFLSRYDVLVTPSVPRTAFEVGGDTPGGWPFDTWMSWTPFTYPFNLSGSPAVSIPCGLTGDGLPVGLQIVGRRYDDLAVMDLASQLGQVLSPITCW